MISLRPYRRAAVPLLAVQTADPAEITRLAVAEAQNGDKSSPVLAWNCIHGIVPMNEEAKNLALNLNGNTEQDSAVMTGNPIEALRALERIGTEDIGSKSIIVMLGMADILADQNAGLQAKQALWNLRNVLPAQGALLILTVPIGWRNPFPDDVAVLLAPLPTREEHMEIAEKLCEGADIKPPSRADRERIGDALLGLSAFASEQALALSLTKQGIDIASLWAHKRQQISETPGLSVYAGAETFNDLGGLDQAKKLFRSILNGKRKPGCVVFIDEGEKGMAGSGTDTSGVAQDQLGCLLTYMQDYNATGSIFVGPPGAAKSAFAKAIGNEGGIPTVSLDLGAVKGSLVGESERRMRTALSVITAISGGRPLFIMTCNSIAILPPELKRRFTMGTMFFDLPSEAERATIWPIYLKKYGLTKQKLPDSEGWTGAEIRQCCDMADRLGVTLVEAAKFVIPVNVSAREKIDTLRKDADQRYLSASGDGIYRYGKLTTTTGKRKVTLD